jgi:regulator of sirC expression with transglutaminase-like and TPR domain
LLSLFWHTHEAGFSMSATAVNPASHGFTEPQRAALLTLLADDDPAVWKTVRRTILASGPLAEPWLRPHSLSPDPVTRRRVREILGQVARQAADDRFLAFCLNRGQDFDLEAAVWLLAQTRYPEINVAGYQALLDSYAADLAQRLQEVKPGRPLLRRFNQHLVQALGFHGNEADYYHPDNSYLNRVLDRRTGNPISLCLVHIFVARRLRLPIAGIAMPGHFICRYQTSLETIYIDAFNHGQLLTKADCVRYLHQSTHTPRDGALRPASPRRTLLRCCSNLHQIYCQRGTQSEAQRLQRYVVALTN